MNKVDLTWLSAERIAAMVEGTLSPHAKVEHNVRLPVLGSSRKRQCDVVVTFGTEPRTLIAIIEVQKRKRKPDINTFHGWYRKMQEVGAQQLFCVSAAGFPASIIEEVGQKIGPTVRLLTLSDIQAANVGAFGFYLSPTLLQTNPKFSIQSLGPLMLRGLPEQISGQDSVSSSDKCFSAGIEGISLNLYELIAALLNQNAPVPNIAPHEPLPPSHDVTIVVDDSAGIWFHKGHDKYIIKSFTIKVSIHLERTLVDIPTINLKYHQEVLNDTLAWVSKSIIPHNGLEVELTVVAVPKPNGVWSIETLLNWGKGKVRM